MNHLDISKFSFQLKKNHMILNRVVCKHAWACSCSTNMCTMVILWRSDSLGCSSYLLTLSQDRVSSSPLCTPEQLVHGLTGLLLAPSPTSPKQQRDYRGLPPGPASCGFWGSGPFLLLSQQTLHLLSHLDSPKVMLWEGYDKKYISSQHIGAAQTVYYEKQSSKHKTIPKVIENWGYIAMQVTSVVEKTDRLWNAPVKDEWMAEPPLGPQRTIS